MYLCINRLSYTRFFHASDVVGRKIVVHGGWDETNTYGDIWIFNTDSFTWMQPKTSGDTHNCHSCRDRTSNDALQTFVCAFMYVMS